MLRLIFFLVLLSPSIALAHSWYSAGCCSDRDCFPLPAGAVVAADNGWRLTDGTVVPYNDSRVRPSQDDRFHQCVIESSDHLRCLYVPDMGS